MDPRLTYADLVGKLHDALNVEHRARRQMLTCEPGSPEGHRWHGVMTAAGRAADEFKCAARSHPDAPPQG